MSESRAHQLQKDHRLSNAIRNLEEMGKEFSLGPDSDILSEIVFLGDKSEDAVNTLLEMAIIYQRMTSDVDKAEVARWAQIELDRAKGALDYAAGGIKVYLPSLTSTAAAAEARALRDRLQELRRELDQYHY
jgi:hypothetical protein